MSQEPLDVGNVRFDFREFNVKEKVESVEAKVKSERLSMAFSIILVSGSSSLLSSWGFRSSQWTHFGSRGVLHEPLQGRQEDRFLDYETACCWARLARQATSSAGSFGPLGRTFARIS